MRPKLGLEKQTRRYVIIVQRDGDGMIRRRKVMNKSDKIKWEEVIWDDN